VRHRSQQQRRSALRSESGVRGQAVVAARHVVWVGYAASAWAFVFATISFYWAAGGTVGLATLGSTIQALALARDPLTVVIGGWGAGLAKVIG